MTQADITSPILLQLRLRHVEQADLPSLEWEGTYRHYRRVYADAYQRQLKGLSILWLAELPEQGVVGQVFIQLICDRKELADGSQRAYLYAFRVKPQYRSLGIGARMLKTVMADLKQREYNALTLNVAKDNPRAMQFYQRYGFQVVADEPGRWSYPDDRGIWRNVVEPAWRMQRSL